MSDTQQSWLVTGATGFLGRHVVNAIRQNDPAARIVALVRDRSRARMLDFLEDVDFIEGSLLDTAGWKDDERLGGVAGIYHLAAEVRHSRSGTEGMTRLNVEGATSMVRLAAELKCRMVFVSTSGTVGCSTSPDSSPDEDAPFAEAIVRHWPYYVSKVKAEKEARAVASRLGAGLVIMRPPVLLGPGDHRYRSVGNVLRVLRGRLPFILTGGMHFADIRDAAAAMVAAMRHPAPQPVYNLPGTASSLDGFFRRVAKVAGITPSWRIIPARLIWYASQINQITGRRLHVLPDPVVVEMAGHYWGLSSKHSQRDLGYQSRDPDQTIADTIEWIRRDASLSGSSG